MRRRRGGGVRARGTCGGEEGREVAAGRVGWRFQEEGRAQWLRGWDAQLCIQIVDVVVGPGCPAVVIGPCRSRSLFSTMEPALRS